MKLDKTYEIRELIKNYKDIQYRRIRTYNSITNFVRDKIKPLIEKKGDKLVLPKELIYLNWNDEILDTIYNTNKYSKITDSILSGNIQFPYEITRLVWLCHRYIEFEKEVYNEIDAFSRENKFRYLYLDKIKGVGAIAASGIIAWLSPLSRFSNPSKLWKYTGWGMEAVCNKCGKVYLQGESKSNWERILKGQNKDPDKYLCYCSNPEIEYVPQRKKRGILMTYNPKIKDFFYVIAGVFIRNKSRGSYYGKKYDVYKAEARAKHSGWTDGHVRSYAIRKMIREFQTHIWMAWWFIMEEKQPPANPYVIDRMKHADLTYPMVDIVKPNFELRSVDDVQTLYEIGEKRKVIIR